MVDSGQVVGSDSVKTNSRQVVGVDQQTDSIASRLLLGLTSLKDTAEVVDFRDKFPFLSDLCVARGTTADSTESPFDCEGGSEVGVDEPYGRAGVDVGVGTGVKVDISPSGCFGFGGSAEESDRLLDLLLSLNDTAKVDDFQDDFSLFVGLMRPKGNSSKLSRISTVREEAKQVLTNPMDAPV
ncbi:UNVERIFIED_CONTAM: hypothetical protein K2H54_057982 [Gekko kuhli]